VDRPLIAIVMDTASSFDREISAGTAQYAREVGDWQLYVEEERGQRLPNLMHEPTAPDAQPVSILVPPIGIVPRASMETLAVADSIIARVIETIRERAFDPR
jgi:rhamnose utilization protein RhaD (predicted bifunctional aldolase and dehydrogenase)